jgi:hypothetical protein
MKKEDIREYYPNGRIKHSTRFSVDGNIYEEYYNENGCYDRINKPSYIVYNNNYRTYEAYHLNGDWTNIYNPARLFYSKLKKIIKKIYNINGRFFQSKLSWMNNIKNI